MYIKYNKFSHKSFLSVLYPKVLQLQEIPKLVLNTNYQAMLIFSTFAIFITQPLWKLTQDGQDDIQPNDIYLVPYFKQPPFSHSAFRRSWRVYSCNAYQCILRPCRFISVDKEEQSGGTVDWPPKIQTTNLIRPS